MNPVWDQQEREAELLAICKEIFQSSRTQLFLHMRFLEQALGTLRLQEDWTVTLAGTQGIHFYYQPEEVIRLFGKDPVLVTRLCLHTVFHCLFAHIYPQEDRDPEYWNLACDVAAEHLLDHLYEKSIHLPMSQTRRQVYGWLERSVKAVTAQSVYRQLQKLHLQQEKMEVLKREFCRDDHRKWYEASRKQPQCQVQRKKWEELRDKMQTEMETFSKEASQEEGNLLSKLRIHNRNRQNYREFLRKFSVLKEEMKVDLDTFDYIFYHYGMELYGNMPLIEPLETKEELKIQDFVIVIDTSMSCRGELVEKFLEETYGILSRRESFFRKIHIHILQCDDKVQSDTLIEKEEDLRNYMKHLELKGGGGTDFRPAFAYVEELLARKVFHKLRGLIYFTDGYGTYPHKMPPYETAFVFLEEDYRDVDVPPWAMKLIIREEDLEEGDSEDEY